MKVINCRNVNDGLHNALHLIKDYSVLTMSRNGMTLEIPCPVATVYEKPWERVLINKKRDANPFFHFFESLWILAGRQDVKFLTEFNKRMPEYSDDGQVFNAPYGHRLRYGFDQLNEIIKILKDDPNSRQCVAQIWDQNDLGKRTFDKACNLSIVFNIRFGELNMTVYNRSNDVLWGTFGANVVQFSMIQEYVAAKLGVRIGVYTQVSNSFHAYVDGPGGDLYDQMTEPKIDNFNTNPYQNYEQLISMLSSDMEEFDRDLKAFFEIYDNASYDNASLTRILELKHWESHYFNYLVIPMLVVFIVYKQQGRDAALTFVDQIEGDDWLTSAIIWLENRSK